MYNKFPFTHYLYPSLAFKQIPEHLSLHYKSFSVSLKHKDSFIRSITTMPLSTLKRILNNDLISSLFCLTFSLLIGTFLQKHALHFHLLPLPSPGGPEAAPCSGKPLLPSEPGMVSSFTSLPMWLWASDSPLFPLLETVYYI